MKILRNKKILITGSLGLIGFEATIYFLKKNYQVIGIDNNLRAKLFKIKTNYQQKLGYLKKFFNNQYFHYPNDIRDKEKIEQIFKKDKGKISLIIHTAAQTSHDWSAKDPATDFSVNAIATLNLLEFYRQYLPKAVFIFTSTNKVYGDLVNKFKYKEYNSRYDLEKNNKYYQGIDESFSIDQSTHSPFGVSKASADFLVQEYGKYFGLKTGIFRLGVVAGGGQNGALEQGFLSYMIDKVKNDREFTFIGYKGKQVRDIIHAKDVVRAFYSFYKNPKKGEVFNIGGGRKNSVSVLELLKKIEKIANKKIEIKECKNPRKGDHKWWISNTNKFKKFYPSWKIEHSINDIILDIYFKKL